MGKSFFTIGALLGFLTGVAAYRVLPFEWALWLHFFVGALVMLGASFCGRFFGGSSFVVARLLAVMMIFMCLGLGRAALSEHHVTPEQVDFYNGQTLELTGLIVEEDVRRDHAKYRVAVSAGEGRLLKGDVLVTLDKYPQYHYGERVQLYGELEEPGEFDGFSYSNYLSRFGIHSVMYRPQVTVLSEEKGNPFWALMNRARSVFMGKINQLFPEPHASFEAGLLVGARKGIPEDLMEKFNITGLTHIIAISGYNITIIIVFIGWLLGGLPRMTGFAVAMGAIVLFTLFVGASPAVTRAAIMGILGLIALNYGRQNNIHITVLMSATLMVLWNPKILWWDVGFQLSFAAVLGLIYVAPLFEKWGNLLPKAMGIREAILMTLSAQVIALPIIVYNFERLSLIAPIANLLVAFALPPAMLFGFIAVVLSFFAPFFASIFAYLTWGILSYIIGVTEITAAIPYASVDIANMTFWMMGVYYGGLGAWLVWWNRRVRPSPEHSSPKSS